MTERPILFSGPMVRAILEGRKTQTRRIMKPQPSPGAKMVSGINPKYWSDGGVHGSPAWGCPYGQPGDRLWVRETFCSGIIVNGVGVAYKADTKPEHYKKMKWTPSIFMPKMLSRITLEIESIRVERLQDISEADAMDEGVRLRGITRFEGEAKAAYQTLWNSINGNWDENPWVWVLTFRYLK